MRFFLDNCISPRLASALRILAELQKNEIVHLQDKFPRDEKDEVWIRTLAQEGDWLIVSGDPRITRGKQQREAWLESGLTAFFLGEGWSEKAIWKQASELFRWWPDIVLKAREARPGSGFILLAGAREMKEVRQQSSRPQRKPRV